MSAAQFPWKQNRVGWDYLKHIQGGALGGAGGNLGSLLDDLDTGIRNIDTTAPDMAARRAETDRVTADLERRYGSDVNRLGGLINETNALVATASTGESRVAIGRAAVQGLALIVNAVSPGLGSIMQAAVEILWLAASAAGSAISDYARRSDDKEVSYNRFLHFAGYATGAAGTRVEQEALARAYKDGWILYSIDNRSSGINWSFRTRMEMWYQLSNVCADGVTWMVMQGVIPVLQAVAGDLDRQLLAETDPSGTEEYRKWLSLADKTFPGGRRRFESIWGIDLPGVRNVGGVTGSTPADVGIKDLKAISMWSTRGASSLFDVFACKLSALPVEMWNKVKAGLLAEGDDEPCDLGAKDILRTMKARALMARLPQGAVLLTSALALAASPRALTEVFRPVRSEAAYRPGASPGLGPVPIVAGLGIAGLLAYLALK